MFVILLYIIVFVSTCEYVEREIVLSPLGEFNRSIHGSFLGLYVEVVNATLERNFVEVEIVDRITKKSIFKKKEFSFFKENINVFSISNPMLQVTNTNDSRNVIIRINSIVSHDPECDYTVKKDVSISEWSKFPLFDNSTQISISLAEKNSQIIAFLRETSQSNYIVCNWKSNDKHWTLIDPGESYNLLFQNLGKEECQLTVNITFFIKFPVIEYHEFYVTLDSSNNTQWNIPKHINILYVAFDSLPAKKKKRDATLNLYQDGSLIYQRDPIQDLRERFQIKDQTNNSLILRIDGGDNNELSGRFLYTNYDKFYVSTVFSKHISKKNKMMTYTLFSDVTFLEYDTQFKGGDAKFEVVRTDLPVDNIIKVENHDNSYSGDVDLKPYIEYAINISCKKDDTDWNLKGVFQMKAFSKKSESSWKTWYSVLIAVVSTFLALGCVFIISVLICLFSPKINCVGKCVSFISGNKKKEKKESEGIGPSIGYDDKKEGYEQISDFDDVATLSHFVVDDNDNDNNDDGDQIPIGDDWNGNNPSVFVGYENNMKQDEII